MKCLSPGGLRGWLRTEHHGTRAGQAWRRCQFWVEAGGGGRGRGDDGRERAGDRGFRPGLVRDLAPLLLLLLGNKHLKVQDELGLLVPVHKLRELLRLARKCGQQRLQQGVAKLISVCHGRLQLVPEVIEVPVWKRGLPGVVFCGPPSGAFRVRRGRGGPGAVKGDSVTIIRFHPAEGPDDQVIVTSLVVIIKGIKLQ